MKQRWPLMLAIGMLTFVICGAGRPNETLEAQSHDARIKAAIKAKLASRIDAVTLTSVGVNVTDGVVTLAGPVHSVEEAERIASLAQGVAGVRRVNDELQVLGQQPVKPVPPSAKPDTKP
jgi:BON domain